MKDQHGVRTHEYIAETEELSELARDTMKEIMLGQDATGKHPPFSWAREPQEKHLYKALGHITHHLKQLQGFEEPDGENHLANALNRVVMALAIENHKDKSYEQATL